jgi:hypothetical protein
VVSVWRHPLDDQRGTEGYRMVVAFAEPDGSEQRVALSGLYRVEADAVGRPVALLRNPDHPVQIAAESPWNWIGAWVYGGAGAAVPRLAPLHVDDRAEVHNSTLPYCERDFATRPTRIYIIGDLNLLRTGPFPHAGAGERPRRQRAMPLQMGMCDWTPRIGVNSALPCNSGPHTIELL